MLGSMTTRPHRKLGELRRILRAIAELDDDIENLRSGSLRGSKTIGDSSRPHGDDD
jgi:hypothetical protein